MPTPAQEPPIPRQTVSELIQAVGHVAKNIDLDYFEYDTDFGVRIVARDVDNFHEWAAAIRADRFSNGTDLGFHTVTATGELARIPVVVILRRQQIGAAS